MSLASQKRKKILIAASSAVVGAGAFGYALQSTSNKAVVQPVAAATTTTTTSNLGQPGKGGAVPTIGAPGVPGTSPAALPAAASPSPNANGIALKSGNVAMAIPYDSTKDVGGFVSAGDHLDVLVADGKGGASYGLTDITVLKLGAAADAAAGSGKVLVVSVSREQARTFQVLTGAGANTPYTFVVRAPSDTTASS